MTNSLYVKRLQVDYPKFVLKDLHFSLEPGEVVVMIGKNGAGKTTAMRGLLGMVNASVYDVEYNGTRIDESNIHLFRKIVGYAGGSNGFYPKITVENILWFMDKTYSDWDTKLADYYINDVFSIDAKKKIGELSSGNIVRLQLLIALSHSADLLFLDEPTSGLDPVVREELLRILHTNAKKEKKAILFSTHLTEDIKKIANRVLFIVNGALMYDLRLADMDRRFRKIPKESIDDFLLRYSIVKVYPLSEEELIVEIEQKDHEEVVLNESVHKAVRLEELLVAFDDGGMNR